MPLSFFALCKTNNGIQVKRIRLANPVRIELERKFTAQKVELIAGVRNEVTFDGDWHPEADEILTLAVTPEIQTCIDAVSINAANINDLTLGSFSTEPIKAIFSAFTNNGQTEILMQKFSPSQILGRNNITLLLNENTFEKLTTDAFSIDKKLVCIIEGGLVKFKGFHTLRTIFNLSSFFTVATDGDIDDFAAHATLNFADINGFKLSADVGMRKQIHAIHKNDTLNNYTGAQIQIAGQRAGLNFTINNGQIEIPDDKAEVKKMLYFLNDGLYEAPLSSLHYIAGAKKRV